MSRISCCYMNYEWGKEGKDSLVYKLLYSSGKIDLDSTKKYAELWMGDHEKGPSLLENGHRIHDKYGKIEFLSKVLSVAKPLSIQVHPNKRLAEKLHSNDPTNYPDPNDKPEVALFITESAIMYGFRPYYEIIEFLKRVEVFREIVTDKIATEFVNNPSSELLKSIVTKIITTDKKSTPKICGKIGELIKNKEFSDIKELQFALEHIYEHFPDDYGLFFPFIMNVVIGKPGEAIYIPTGTLHCYLIGDLYEIMVSSDNCIRAGLTPKFIDFENILSAVDFVPREPFYISPVVDGFVKRYEPTINLCIATIDVEPEKTANLTTNYLSFCLAIGGKGIVNNVDVQVGNALLLKPEPIEIKNNGEENFKCAVFWYSK